MRAQSRIVCLLWGPYQSLLLHPVTSPAKGSSQPLKEPVLSGPLSGLSLQRLLWAAGPQSWLPSVCLSPALPSPNAICPSWGIRCLPAACLPAACPSRPHAGCRKEPKPCLAHHPLQIPPVLEGLCQLEPLTCRTHKPSPGSCPDPIGLSSASQAGRHTDEPASQRVALPDSGTEHRAAGSLGPLPTVSPAWSASLLLGSQVQCCPQDQSPG